MKNLNYKILDSFEHPSGGVIVSIASPELDKLSEDEIKNRVGNQVAILDNDTQEKKLIKVSDIDITSSIIDKKNVHICLGNLIKLSDIKPNSSILIVTEEENIKVVEKLYRKEIIT